MRPEPLPRPQWLGRLEYRWALGLQRARRQAVIAGTAPEAFWLLEHDPVVTIGRRAVPDLDVALPVVATERGGLATWHGPGQLVGYPILDVGRRRGSVRGTVAALEQGIASWLDTLGIRAGRREGCPGVWVGTDKICALGIHFRRGVTLHGFALNLDPDLTAFSTFTPCGISAGGVTSVAAVLGSAPAPHEVAAEVGRHVLAAFVDTLSPHD